MTNYLSNFELLNNLRWLQRIPRRVNGRIDLEEQKLEKEGDKYYFQFENIIEEGLNVFYGTFDSPNPLIVEDDYEIDFVNSSIKLTSAGESKVGNSMVFAQFAYNNFGLDNDYITGLLTRVTKAIDRDINSTFVVDKPNPQFQVRELETSNRGFFDNWYYPIERPVQDIKSRLVADIDENSTQIQLEANTGHFFPSEGKVLLGTEIIDYTSIDNDVMTIVRGDNAKSHKAGDLISTIIFEINQQPEGFVMLRLPFPEGFETLQRERDFTVTDSGAIVMYHNRLNFRLPREVEGRVRLRYLFGYLGVNEDIKRLAFLYALKELKSTTFSRSMIEGRDEFNPEMFNFDEAEIQRIIHKYRAVPMGNT